MRRTVLIGAVAALGLAGCVAVPPPPVYAVPGAVPAPAADAPLVAVPGQGKTEAQFQADDRVCRADVARLPARQGQPTAAQLRAAQAAEADPNAPPPPPSALPPGAAFLRCMTARGNQVQPLQAQGQGQVLPVYANLPAYPVYAGVGYGYPYFYDDVFLLRYYGGFGYRGYGYGRFGFGGYGPGFYGRGYYGGGYYGRGYYGRGFGGRGYGGRYGRR